MPSSITLQRPSGRFVLRLDPEVHATLRNAAREAGLSLNEYCARKLTAPSVPAGSAAGAAVTAAAKVAGEHLRAVVAFGSWARGEAAAHSDVDLLVVVAPGLAVTRRLYQVWDRAPVAWEGRRVEPHFVHQPAGGERPSSLWLEVATDGIVLFDPDLGVSRHLASLRRLIAEGRMRRQSVHGQAYWKREVGDAQ